MSYDRHQPPPYVAGPTRPILPPPPAPRPHGSPWRNLLIVAVCLVVAGGVWWQFTQQDSTGPTSKPVTMNTPARDGDLEFTATATRCGQQTIGTGLFQKTAKGTWCTVALTVRNTGDTAVTFDAGDQVGIDRSGARYEEATRRWTARLNPGLSEKGTLAFDVPAGTKLTAVELHALSSSTGVNVIVK